MLNKLKIFLVIDDLIYNTKKFIFRLFNKKCFFCGDILYKKEAKSCIKNILNLNYKEDLCVDCFLKKNKLEFIVQKTKNIVKCKCGKSAKIIKFKNKWIIICTSCNIIVAEKKLNECLHKWQN